MGGECTTRLSNGGVRTERSRVKRGEEAGWEARLRVAMSFESAGWNGIPCEVMHQKLAIGIVMRQQAEASRSDTAKG
jgi:hypothetical protein